MSFNPNIPQPGDLLSDSQGDLLQNMLALDTSFGIDHYTFSNLTVNNGAHRQVSSPISVPPAHPATVNDPKLYGMQDTALIPVIHYSRAPNNAVPSPVTLIQSPSAGIVAAGGTSTNILDLTGLVNCYGSVMAQAFGAGATRSLFGLFFYRGAATLTVQNVFSNGLTLIPNVPANILQIFNTAPVTEFRYTIQLWRTE